MRMMKNRRRLKIDELADRISSDPLLLADAVVRTKREVARIYGYSKYERDEISYEIRERLYNLGYLGASVAAIIIDDDRISEETKTGLAKGYLEAVIEYVDGKLAKPTRDYWSDAEPMCTAEAAAYLAERDKFEWKDNRLLSATLAFAEHSSTTARRSFLSNLVEQINVNEELRLKLSNPIVRGVYSEFFRSLSATRLKEEGIGEDWKAKIMMLENIGALLCADSVCASAGILCELTCLTDDDLVQLFASGLLIFILRRINNRTSFYIDLAAGIIGRRKKGGVPEGETLGLLFGALKKASSIERGPFKKRVHVDDAKLEALIRLGGKIEVGKVPPGIVETAMGFADHSMQTATRFALLKFAYEKSWSDEERRRVLDRAEMNSSSKIREWVASARTMPQRG